MQPHESFFWIWKSKCTPKLKFFCWLVLADRLNTRNMLRRRQFNINTGFNCLLCQNPPEETVEHLLFQCDFSAQCWNFLGLDWIAQGSHLDIISNGRNSWNKPMFMEIFAVAAWHIWKQRNNLYFNGVPPCVQDWKTKFQADFLLLVHRTKASLHPFIHSFVQGL